MDRANSPTDSFMAVLDQAGVRPSTHCFVVYEGMVDEDSDGPVEVCMAFEGEVDVPNGVAG